MPTGSRSSVRARPSPSSVSRSSASSGSAMQHLLGLLEKLSYTGPFPHFGRQLVVDTHGLLGGRLRLVVAAEFMQGASAAVQHGDEVDPVGGRPLGRELAIEDGRFGVRVGGPLGPAE